MSKYLVIISLLLYGCVGPPEPDDGLIDNLPSIINTSNVFSFSLRGDKYDFNESYDLSFLLDSNSLLSTTLIIDEFSGSDTTSIFVNNSSDSTLYWYLVLGNSVYTRSDTMSANFLSYPSKINVVGTQFNGVVDFQIIKQ
tara:strand:+ start:375 stop:794 length:420 start_codon:yes stop_codon:yes gene_type:complete